MNTMYTFIGFLSVIFKTALSRNMLIETGKSLRDSFSIRDGPSRADVLQIRTALKQVHEFALSIETRPTANSIVGSTDWTNAASNNYNT